MGNHRAQRGPRRSTSAAPVDRPVVGKRRATVPARRSALLRTLPSAPILLGVTALAISAGGAVTAADAHLAGQITSGGSSVATARTMDLAAVAPTATRDAVVSRDSRRDARADAREEQVGDRRGRHDPVQDQRNRRRDDDAERGAGADQTQR